MEIGTFVSGPPKYKGNFTAILNNAENVKLQTINQMKELLLLMTEKLLFYYQIVI